MGPPVQPPAPPPPYEEDPNAQAAAARGYVYPYPPYGYPAQVCISSSFSFFALAPFSFLRLCRVLAIRFLYCVLTFSVPLYPLEILT